MRSPPPRGDGHSRASRSRSPTRLHHLPLLLAGLLIWLLGATSTQALEFDQYPGELGSARLDLALLTPAFPGANRIADAETPDLEWPVSAVYHDDELLGYAFESAQVTPIPAYSGKPVNLLIGIDLDAKITQAKVLNHAEPIMLVGIPQQKLDDFAGAHVGARVTDRLAVGEGLDAISGATVTVIVVNDTILRAARQVAAAVGLIADPSAAPRATVSPEVFSAESWATLTADGSIGHLRLTNGTVDDAFIGTPAEHYLNNAKGPRDATFIDLYFAYLDAPTIGRNLLGERGFAALMKGLEPGEHAVVVMASGDYSYKGSGYVRGGIFDRIELVQNNATISFHDRDQKRVNRFALDDMPAFSERDIFIIREAADFDPGSPWQLNLLVRRASGPLSNEFTRFEADYALPEAYLERPQPVTPTPLWMKVWQDKTPEVIGLGIGLVTLTLILAFQDALARRPRLLRPLRTAFLIYTLVFVGWIALVQLSIVNLLALVHSLTHQFQWSAFLIDPLMFVMWTFVAMTLVLWGRGVYCGWLCPFGALQDLVNRVARYLKVPQFEPSFALHQRLWVIKYLVLFALVGVSFYSLGDAERLAEIEPFKTAITLHFMRDWGFVAYALALIVASAFTHKAYCRYVCPLGAGLAIGGRLRLFDWLRRHRGHCGTPCQICAHDCEVAAIHPDGRIDASECHYCLDCQITFDDDQRCPPRVKRRKRITRDTSHAGADATVDAAPRGAQRHLADPRRIPCQQEH
ncbi:4Fe-4S binding protein [Halomonas sp. V046]|uniref:4Fe-4S binding protein n=1 Tax=Halomonas sp. V046 TaxID=3459611 RepID=UPI004043A6E9